MKHSTKGNILKEIFSAFDEHCIEYIMLRKHDCKPDTFSIKNDIDLLCKKEQRKAIKHVFSERRFSFYQDSALKNVYLYGVSAHEHFINKKDDLHFDVVYKLSYRSINRGEWIPVHDDLQQDIWNNKIVCNGAYWKCVPSHLDELIHILCHCLLDKRDINDHYRTRIKELLRFVSIDDLIAKLSLVFFKFTPALIEHINRNNFEGLFDKYISFKEY